MNKKLNILLTGPVPPPAGGISIHIQRLKYLLQDEFNIDIIDESDQKKTEVFNFRSLKIFSYLKKISKADLLFIHSGNKLFKKIHIITGRLFGKKIIITLHGYGKKRKQPFRAIDNFIFKRANKIILVNNGIADMLSLPANKYIVKHAFLPPVMKYEPALPATIVQWINKERQQNRTIICANASRLNIRNGQDLYGLDMSIEITRRLALKNIPISFIYTVSSIEGCEDIFNKNLQLIATHKLQDHFLLLNERLSFVKLIEQCDIVLRPTNADGDALTVREALYLGKTAIASDVVERPMGTILFKTRNYDDLEIKLEQIIKNMLEHKNIPVIAESITGEDFKPFYINLIKTVALK